MDEDSAAQEAREATPIFTAYRRGYDPDQVDRFVADQRRRLDDATTRASEAERKLAAAVGQLRELHRRVAVLENEERPNPAPALDSIGERIQRILQEAWDGAYAMRQAAESDASELRERTRVEATEIIAGAKRKAAELDEELERRRNGYLQRIEEEQSKAVAQMTFLQSQRKLALEELMRIRTLLDATVDEFSESASRSRTSAESPPPASQDRPLARERETDPRTLISEEAIRPMLRAVAPLQPPSDAPKPAGDGLPSTMPVHQLAAEPPVARDPSELVRAHRALHEHSSTSSLSDSTSSLSEQPARASVFDFEAAQPHDA